MTTHQEPSSLLDNPPKKTSLQQPRQRRQKEIKVKMTLAEYTAAQQKAKKAGYPLATYARQVILNKPIVNRQEHAINVKWLSQLAWLGNNLNQIAKVVNGYRAKNLLDALQLDEINLRLAELQEELDDFKRLIDLDKKQKDDHFDAG